MDYICAPELATYLLRKSFFDFGALLSAAACGLPFPMHYYMTDELNVLLGLKVLDYAFSYLIEFSWFKTIDSAD